jgi:malonate decarboxylase beta subunit
MQLITATYPATTPVDTDTHVGVVGSGDLEILVSPPTATDTVTVTVRTSVDGFDTTWRGVLDQFFSRNELACDVQVNDFGATPGMVSLRLAQAFDIAETRDDEVTRGTDGVPFTELNARQRAAVLLDPGTFREILGPFDHVESSHLEPQGIVPSSDDGAVIARGTIDDVPTAVVALEGKFQGGGIGEVSGAKIAAVLERALVDAEAGHPVRVILLLETGGIRLQEANLGLLAIAEIHSGIVALQKHVPVTAVVAGMVGCFGGMGIAAGLCDNIIMTRAGRLALNGPEVIETEAGIEEFNSADRRTVWAVTGGEHRVTTGRADRLVADSHRAVREAVIAGWNEPPTIHRADRVEDLARELADTSAERKN